jgi:hypothetical protein
MDIKAKDRVGVFGRQLRQLGQAVKLATRPKAQETQAQNTPTDTTENQAGFENAMRQSGRASKAQKEAISRNKKELQKLQNELSQKIKKLDKAMGQPSSFDEKALEAELDKIQQTIVD